jgi:hypothetical protein
VALLQMQQEAVCMQRKHPWGHTDRRQTCRVIRMERMGKKEREAHARLLAQSVAPPSKHLQFRQGWHAWQDRLQVPLLLNCICTNRFVLVHAVHACNCQV